MMPKNPKEKFLNLLLNIVSNFEEETGTDIHNIHFKRVIDKEIGEFYSPSLITDIEMEIK